MRGLSVRGISVVLGFALAAAGIAACGSDDTPAREDATSTGSSTASGAGGAEGGAGPAGGGGEGGGVVCPAGSHDDAAGGCAATLTAWGEGPSLAHGRDHHVTFVATTPSGSFLYVAGGTGGSSIFADVEQSPILADGTLSGFVAAGKLVRGVGGAGFAQIDRTIVLAGGLALEGGAAISVTDTSVGTIADDGAISFVAGPPLLTSRYHVTLSAARGFVFAIGGLVQTFSGGAYHQAIVEAVERAPFDGKTLGAFTSIAPLPDALTHHATVVHGDAIYVIGGLTVSNARTDILRADVDESGELGEWTTAGQLPEGRATSAAFVFLDQLYVIAGATKAMGGEKATVLRASFDTDGTVGAFEQLPDLPSARAHAHQAPMLGATLYSAGGSIDHKVQKQVFLGHLE